MSNADWDVFNGDADGLCSLVQLRLAEPRDAVLVTGVKRDIDLLRQVNAKAGDRVTVLDISLDKNRPYLQRILDLGAEVFYIDHHHAGEMPSSASLMSLINETPDVCTSLLVNQYLRGAHARWAVVGTFGDNLKASAEKLARKLSLSSDELPLLEKLGILINYNAYGANLQDLHIAPSELFKRLVKYPDPLEFIADSCQLYQQLEDGYQSDLQAAGSAQVLIANSAIAAYLLPDEPWARRISGVFGNQLANANPGRAHAVLTARAGGNFSVSVRAPLDNKRHAAKLCRQFPTGGGREAAAGIDDLSAEQLPAFLETFEQIYK